MQDGLTMHIIVVSRVRIIRTRTNVDGKEWREECRMKAWQAAELLTEIEMSVIEGFVLWLKHGKHLVWCLNDMTFGGLVTRNDVDEAIRFIWVRFGSAWRNWVALNPRPYYETRMRFYGPMEKPVLNRFS